MELQEYPTERCRRLRTKSMFYITERDPTVPYSNSAIYWCLHTQNCLGPDGNAVGSKQCTPDRPCYEAV